MQQTSILFVRVASFSRKCAIIRLYPIATEGHMRLIMILHKLHRHFEDRSSAPVDMYRAWKPKFRHCFPHTLLAVFNIYYLIIKKENKRAGKGIIHHCVHIVF